MSSKDTNNNDGVQKAAILLMSLGEDDAAEVFKFLGPREVQKIGTAMAALENLTRNEISTVLDDFCNVAGEKATLSPVSSTDYIKQVLRKALGDDRATHLIDRILQGNDTSGIEGLKWMDSQSVAELIKSEHPQIIATILVHLDRDQASEVLMQFTERLRNDTLLRIATLDGIQPQALRELNDVLMKLLSGGDNVKKAPMGGVRAAAEILNFMPQSHETSVIDGVKTYDGDLAQRIVDQMFTWDNVMEIDDRGIQVMLREVQSDQLLLALKGSTPQFRDKIFKNMSSRAAETLREDLEAKGGVRVSEVEATQKEILKIVRRLGEEGQIQLGGKAEEAFI
jgi:flagellar motor switch protein FliG